MKHKHRILIYTVVLLGFLLAQNIILVEAFKPPPGDDPPPRTTYRIYGYVKKAGTNTPLSGATVKLYRGTTTYIGQKTTDSNGYYNFYYTTTSTITKCKSVASKSGYYTSSRIGYMLEGRVRLDHSLTQVPPPPPPPTAPTISNVEITEGITREVTVSWNVAWGTGATQYYVECYWGTDANLDSGNKIYYQAVSSTTTTFSCQVPPDLVAYSGGTYYYKVYARNTNTAGYADDTVGPSSVVISGEWPMELRSCAYNLADAGSYINDQIDISLFTEDMNYIKSLGFNAVKLWTDGSLGFWTTDYQLHQALSITDSLNLKVCLASIPEMAAEGWEDQYGNTPNKDELFYMAEMAKSHPSVIAHAIHLNDLAVASGAYGDDFRNNPNKILDDNFPNEGWSINPDCWVTDTNAEPTLAFQNSQYYEESLLGMKPGCIDYNYGWIYQDLGNINLNVYNTITIRIHSLDAGAKWALKVMVDTTLVELQADISKTGIYQYKISGFTGYHDIQIQLYAIDGDGGNNDYVYFDWITYGMDLININDDTGIDQYRDYYSDIAHGLKNRAPNQQVWFFSDRDPQWGWTPVTEQYWGEDLPVDAFGMQPYSEDRKSFDSNKVERYIRYFGMSGLPVYVDEWGVKDWEYKFVVIASFVICMENGNFPSVTHNEKIIGWTYFILDDVNDGTYGLRVNRISKGFESLFQDLLLYRPMGWSDQTTPAGHYYVADQKSINNIGLSHEMTTAGSGDSGYTFMWCTNRETFTVRADGTIGITGWFKGYDTLGSLKPGRSYVRVYILDTNGQIIGNYHDALNSGETYGSWYYKSFDFATGLAPGTEIRIGIGRTDDWSTDWGLSFGFSGIKVWAG